ncbi:MAG TPA: methyltransferase domain-containing protein [Nitrososphaeria archaeon]|nr:methyltransferase domain-containing protein [Nitrososphaeria archaeon]
MGGETATFRVKGIEIKLVKDRKIYMPSVATRLIAENLHDVSDLRVLDLGTGSGVLAILASKLGAKNVVATDISERAIRIARRNAEINHVKIDFRIGDLFDPVRDELFDLIISNPPMTPSPIQLPRFTWGGVDGRFILDRIIDDAPSHLRRDGRLILPVISLVGIGRTYQALLERGFIPKVLDYRVHPFGDTLHRLLDHLKSLSDSDYVYDRLGRACWRLVLFEAVKT